MIIVTGAAGFIGSCLVGHLNKAGHENIVVVDDFSKTEKDQNLVGKAITAKVGRDGFMKWLEDFGSEVDFIYHIGARTDTTEFDVSIFDELNLNYSKDIWNLCVKYKIPFVYASSAATYGLGEHGYKDSHDIISKLKPLNPYGDSKNDFDKWILTQTEFPPFWAGLKFFNVYGPNEYHKGRMASVICHYLMASSPASGIYNLGSGTARTFLDLTKNTFKAMGAEENISFIDTPEDIRDKYQYFTEADMTKLVESGFDKGFRTLEEGVADYVENYLTGKKYY